MCVPPHTAPLTIETADWEKEKKRELRGAVCAHMRGMIAVVVMAMIIGCCGQSYLRVIQFAVDSDCSGPALSSVTTTVSSCPSSSSSSSTVCVDSKTQQCFQGGPPGVLDGHVSVVLYNQGVCGGGGLPSSVVSWRNGFCAPFENDSFMVFCYASKLSLVTFRNSSVCAGPSLFSQWKGGECHPFVTDSDTNSGLPFSASGNALFAQCTPLCFHEDSLIQHGDHLFTLHSLRDSSVDCAVPHVTIGNGLKVSTSCSSQPLRVTGDHLVFTPKGLRRAATLNVGDELFGDFGERKMCSVTKVEGEYHQRYFGLNCASGGSVVMR